MTTDPTAPLTPAQQQRLADRLTDRGMHPVTARNVVAHVVIHGKDSPWARQVHIAAVGLSMVLITEYATAYARAVAPVIQQLAQALAAAGRSVQTMQSVGRAPARPAWQSPYGPPSRRRP